VLLNLIKSSKCMTGLWNFSVKLFRWTLKMIAFLKFNFVIKCYNGWEICSYHSLVNWNWLWLALFRGVQSRSWRATVLQRLALTCLKGIVHFEINFWYVLAYLKGIQDVGVFVSTVFSLLIFLGQTVLVCQSYNAGIWDPPQRACTEKSKLNVI